MRRVRLAAGLCAGWMLALSAAAWADNCSTIDDCADTQRGAIILLSALALLALAAFVPELGVMLAIAESVQHAANIAEDLESGNTDAAREETAELLLGLSLAGLGAWAKVTDREALGIALELYDALGTYSDVAEALSALHYTHPETIPMRAPAWAPPVYPPHDSTPWLRRQVGCEQDLYLERGALLYYQPGLPHHVYLTEPPSEGTYVVLRVREDVFMYADDSTNPTRVMLPYDTPVSDALWPAESPSVPGRPPSRLPARQQPRSRTRAISVHAHCHWPARADRVE